MIQGTGSSVGKSLLVAALCRAFHRAGVRVAPFKAQNMALNSFVTRAGDEMGRAQVVQAEAAGIEPTVEMNPVLLKPETDSRSQVIVRGRPLMSLSAADYFGRKLDLWPVVAESLDRLRDAYELVIIEGAGSPAEINLRDKDIVNMRVARYAEAPVLLVGDIDRGGVFASLYGTLALLLPGERELVKGFIINKFRGDVRLLEPGLRMLEDLCGGTPVLGVVNYLRDVGVAEEDSVALDGRGDTPTQSGTIVDIAVIRLPHISNFDDFDSLAAEAGVGVRYVESPAALGSPDLLILPGTKTTVADLSFLRATGLADRIVGLAGAGTPILGICGGFQLLGTRLLDPDSVESSVAEMPGLGLLPVETTFAREKQTCQVSGRVLSGRGLLGAAAGLAVTGYEIHMGQTTGNAAPALRIDERQGGGSSALASQPAGGRDDAPDGATSADGLIVGTYVHGLFGQAPFRRAVLGWLAARRGARMDFGALADRDAAYDRIGEAVRSSLDWGRLLEIIGLPTRVSEVGA